jgi:hypothetical protein
VEFLTSPQNLVTDLRVHARAHTIHSGGSIKLTSFLIYTKIHSRGPLYIGAKIGSCVRVLRVLRVLNWQPGQCFGPLPTNIGREEHMLFCQLRIKQSCPRNIQSHKICPTDKMTRLYASIASSRLQGSWALWKNTNPRLSTYSSPAHYFRVVQRTVRADFV